jgi:hypothetical protein
MRRALGGGSCAGAEREEGELSAEFKFFEPVREFFFLSPSLMIGGVVPCAIDALGALRQMDDAARGQKESRGFGRGAERERGLRGSLLFSKIVESLPNAG